MSKPLNADNELREQLAQLFYDDNYVYMKSRPDMYDIGAIDEAVELIKEHELQARIEEVKRIAKYAGAWMNPSTGERTVNWVNMEAINSRIAELEKDKADDHR